MDKKLADIKDFISNNIGSIEQLEVLLLLHKNRGQEWTASEISQKLVTQPGSVSIRLSDLESKGLLSSRQGERERLYQYRPVWPPREAAVDDLAEFYKIYRLKVIQLIYDRSNESVRMFSEAFRIWKRKDKGAD
jgi:DNA-binding transcriptional ArsR family regulator